MQVIPAIDIRSGRCVRLRQGDYAQETVYDDDPVAVAERWTEQGATRIHVVDLDGAAGDGPRNLDTIRALVAAVAVPIQLGGGLKRRADVEAALSSGVERVVLGTVAVTDRSLLESLVADYGPRVVVGIDARDGLVAVRGWRETSTVRALDLARDIEQAGVSRLIYTDIARDGMLTEPNYDALSQMMAAVSVPVIASGGVAKVDHLRRLRDLGAEAAIVGRALYTGDVDLREALLAMAEEEGASGAH